MGLISTRQYVRKRPSLKKNRDALEQHNEWLRSVGIDPDKKPSREKRKLDTTPKKTVTRLSNNVGNGFLPKEKVYSGTEIIGIATMHKSNAVPVTNKKNAVDISSMR